MRLHENIDFTTLTWVKPELDETLRQARNALQNYVEEGESPAELRTCSDLLHQVQGTLRMVELYGAAMVAEEMEQLSRALIDGKVVNRDPAYAVLMQGIVQLPDYLERLQSGHRDIPIVLLPLLNQLRESRGEKGLNESVLFSPDLSRPLPPSAQGPDTPMDPAELTRRAETLRGLYQGALLRWLKDDNSPATIRDLTDVCEQLVPITWAEPARRLFWVAAGTLDALGKNAFPISNPLKQALSKVEREIKRLAEGGDAAFRANPPIELTKQLLYFVAHEGSDTGRIGEIRNVFGLSGTEPSEAELAHARGSLSGNNRALLETVAVAIKEDLLRVKDALDLHLRTPGASVTELGVQVESLDRVADTLGMLGLGVPRRVVQDQRTAINDVISGQRKGDEETLLDIAGALLYVEAALDDQVERLGKEDTATGDAATAPPSNESRRLLEVLVKEAIVNFAEARQAFVAFVETHWDHSQLAQVPRLLTEVSGALRILNIQEPADYLIGIRQFTDNELLRRKQVPNGQQMDRLADALASLEYFLEALRDRRPNREQILEVARQSLTSLGYWPLTSEMRASSPVAEAAPTKAAAAPVAPAPAAAAPPEPAAPPAPAPPPVAPPVVVAESIPPPPPVPAPTPAAAAPAAPAPSPTPASIPAPAVPAAAPAVASVVVPGFDGSSSEEIDDEIREVFLEEFEEEIDNLAQLLPAWRQEPASAELLRPIRRVFHTLKGSGRLVGAKTLGEFSWKVESLLNRVLDGSRPASPQVIGLVQLALDHLPLLRAALQGQEVRADLEGLQATADLLAAGEEVSYAAAATPAGAAVAEAEPAAPVEMAFEPEPVVEPESEPVAAFEEAGVELPGAVFSIDPVLLEILKPEVAGHLETVDAWLAACAARGPQPVTDPLLRSIHTMNGAFAMTEVVMITDVTAPLEGFVKRALAHHLTPTAEGVAVVADAAKAIRATIAAMEKPRPVLPHFEELSARACALRDALPDSTLSSVPAQVEEETAAMPQVVMLEAADVSAIPQFEAAPEPEAEAIPEIEVAEATIAAPVGTFEPELAIEEIEQPAIEATLEAEPEAAPETELDLGEMAQVQVDREPAVQDVPELAEDFGLIELETAQPAFEEMPAASEIEATAIDEPLSFEEEAVALGEEPISVEQEAASFEQEAASFEPEPAPVEPEAMSFGQDYAAVEEASTTSDRDFALEEIPVSFEEASAPAEAGSYGLHEPAESLAVTPEAAAEAPLALEEAAASRDEPAAIEAESAEDHEPVEKVHAYAELPESEMLSLEDFLRQGSSESTSLEFAEVQPDASLSVMQIDESEEYSGQRMDVEETATDASTAMEFELPGAVASDSMEISEVQAEAVPSLEIEERDPGSEAYGALPPISTAEAAAFDEEASAELAAPIEQAAEAADSAELREQAESNAPAGFDAPELAEVDEDDAVAASAEAEATDAALAGMIAAYPADEETSDVDEAAAEFEPAPATAGGGVFSAEELANADDLLSKGLQFADSEFEVEASPAVSTEAEPQSAASETVAADATPASDYYGMSLDELEAMTAPESAPVAATVEADGFADLPSISELPAWKGETESQAVLETSGSDADANVAMHAEPSAEAVAEPEVAAEPVAEPEVAAAPEVIPEPEVAEEPALVAEPEIAEEPELVAEQEIAVEPELAQIADEVIEEEELEEEEIFDDEPELAAAAPVAAVDPSRAARPSVPTARDEADPETELDVTDLDTELLDLFLEESNDILDHSDGMLARLRDHIDDRETIVNLQRDLHTLKGGARMAGIYAVGELGHAMESLLESVAEGRQKLDATGVVVLERGFDRLHGMVARIGSRKAIALPAGLIAQVEALSEGKSLSEVEIEAPSAPVAKKGAPKQPAAVEAPVQKPLSAPVDEMAAEDEMSGVRAPQEQVRIRADLLDRLVNYAGEVAIYRARLEQQLGAFRANLGELDQTTTRLREQLRRLDIETEAQIVARYQREGESDDERFDPLELDRFTNQQQLTRALNESANDLVNLQGVLDELTRQYETLLLQQSRVSSDLQEGLMRTRMVPFDALVPRLRRVLRQAAIDTGKQVQLKVDGASGEMDRNVLDRMTAPLEHMLRNAMAHGLELPEERRKARKPEEGIVRIAVQREGSEVVLKVTDDGRGLNKEAIRKKAIERGLIKADAEMSDEALYGMILEAGFSTAETVSRLSGRGVGMDVVYSEIRQLGGTLQIKSEQGKGSEFTIRLPFTLAVTQAVFVKIGDTSFAVPIASVRGVGRVSRAELEKQLASENPVFNYAGEDYAIHDLGTLIGHAPAKAQDSLQMPLLLARSGDLRTAISIDQVLGSREIVVKPVGPQVNSVPGIFGATIMGDGRVVVILDVAPLVRRHMAVVKDAVPVVPVAVVPAHRVPVVMVVDDSITMRKVTGRVLERNNMEVLTAKDGVDAVEKMAERVPDLVLLDIEMPRMDGYEVAQNMKSDPRLKDVPIIMITSRTGDKHRQRAMDIGVDRYLGKPYQEQELMRNVFDVLGMEAVND